MITRELTLVHAFTLLVLAQALSETPLEEDNKQGVVHQPLLFQKLFIFGHYLQELFLAKLISLHFEFGLFLKVQILPCRCALQGPLTYPLECGTLEVEHSHYVIGVFPHYIVHDDYVDGLHELDLDGVYPVEPCQHALRVALYVVVVLL
jgi:hypothetical protein